MGSPEFSVQIVDSWKSEELIELYTEAGWWKDGYDPAGIEPLITGSFAFAIATVDNKAVGMGRVISDGVSDGYIQDVVVLKSHRRKGIGSKIIKTLLDHSMKKGLVWVGLIAEPGSEEFYGAIGFKRFRGKPMVFQPEGLDDKC